MNALLKLLRAKLLRRPLELRAKLGRPWSGAGFLEPKLSVRRVVTPRLRARCWKLFALAGGSEAQNLSGGATAGKMGDVAETLRCREMMKSQDSSESESEPEEVRREQEEKSRSKKGPSSSSPLSWWCSEEAAHVLVDAARRAARSRRICMLRQAAKCGRGSTVLRWEPGCKAATGDCCVGGGLGASVGGF
jgi:hypothetical protein